MKEKQRLTAKKTIVAVFDTNIFVARALSQNPNSPILELFERLKDDEFALVWCKAIQDEIIEKLLGKHLEHARIVEFIAEVTRVANFVELSPADITAVIIDDPDDDVVLACAVKGKATHLVTYDTHFDGLGSEYQAIKIVDGLHFLYAVRGNQKTWNNK